MSDNPKTVKIKATDPEQGEFVVINESDFDPTVHERVEPVAVVPPPPALAPPPPPAADPLAALAKDWQTGDAAELKRIAAAVNGGRAVENKAQAVQVINAALAARGK